MNPEQRRLADEMARNRRTIAGIRRTLGIGYWEIWETVPSAVTHSRQGANQLITCRLSPLATADGPTIGERLSQWSDDTGDCLFERGPELGRTLEHALEALE